MMPPLRSFDDLVGKERGQKKTDDLRTMTTLGPRTLYTISLAVSYVLRLFVLIFVQYRTISIGMTRIAS